MPETGDLGSGGWGSDIRTGRSGASGHRAGNDVQGQNPLGGTGGGEGAGSEVSPRALG